MYAWESNSDDPLSRHEQYFNTINKGSKRILSAKAPNFPKHFLQPGIPRTLIFPSTVII
jgi:hypothetical protein